MTKRFDVCTPRDDEKTGKTYWTRLGVAFQSEKGISIQLDGVPINGKLRLFELRPHGGGAPQRAPAGRDDSDDMLFDMPF